MEIVHDWKVRRLIQKNDGSGIVSQVFYKVHSTDGEYFAISAGNVELETNNIVDFVPYIDLTEELVIQWVKNRLGPSLGNHEQYNSDHIISIKSASPPETKEEILPWEIVEVTPDPTPI